MKKGTFSHDEDEVLSTTQVDGDILCKDCKMRDDGTPYSNPYTKGSCKAYPYPDSKPLDVLFGNSRECKHYEKE